MTPSKKRKKTKKSNPNSSLSFEEVYKAVGVEDLDSLEQAIFLNRSTFSVVPALQYYRPLDEAAFYTLNFPYIKFVYFSR